MDINDLTVRQAKELSTMFTASGGQCSAEGLDGFAVGDTVIVRTYSAYFARPLAPPVHRGRKPLAWRAVGDALLQRKSLKKSLLSITNFKFISLNTKSVLQEEEKRSASNAHKGRYDSP